MNTIFKREGSVGKPVVLYSKHPSAGRRAKIRSLSADAITVSFKGTNDVSIWRATTPVVGSIVISSSCNKIDFKESGGGAQLTATLVNRTYDPGELASQVKLRMEQVGAATYTVTYNPVTKAFTIATSGSYLSLLWATGTNNASAADTPLGFSADKTGALTYTGSGIGQLPTWSDAASRESVSAITISGANDKIDFLEADGGAEKTASLTRGIYQDPAALALEVATKMMAAGTKVYTCTYNAALLKFTIATTNGTWLEILWNTGTNTATCAAAALGFSTAADSTGALTYTGSAITVPTVSIEHGSSVVVSGYENLDVLLPGGYSILKLQQSSGVLEFSALDNENLADAYEELL